MDELKHEVCALCTPRPKYYSATSDENHHMPLSSCKATQFTYERAVRIAKILQGFYPLLEIIVVSENDKYYEPVDENDIIISRREERKKRAAERYGIKIE